MSPWKKEYHLQIKSCLVAFWVLSVLFFHDSQPGERDVPASSPSACFAYPAAVGAVARHLMKPQGQRLWSKPCSKRPGRLDFCSCFTRRKWRHRMPPLLFFQGKKTGEAACDEVPNLQKCNRQRIKCEVTHEFSYQRYHL